jgi:hypothetical protein
MLVVMVMNSRGQVPWCKQMRRVRTGITQKVEWMAPDAVVNQVRHDYLTTVRWMHDHGLSSPAYQMAYAEMYLSGEVLRDFRCRVKENAAERSVLFTGVLRGAHMLEIRRFSQDGEHCLLIDYQSQRRMATYDMRTHQRVLTQDMGDAVLVWSMQYDRAAKRWKQDRFVQELPAVWGKPRARQLLREEPALPDPFTFGRDS